MKREQYLAKRNELLAKAEGLLTEGKIEDFNAVETEIKNLDTSFEAIAKAQANISALKDTQIGGGAGVMQDSKLDGGIDAIAEDKYGTKEYRMAFMNFAKTGQVSKQLFNADEFTSTTESAAVIPTTIMQEIIKEMESYGQIFSRIRKISIKGGIEVPILSLKPVATWITESTPSDRKKINTSTKVSFSYYGLECKVAVSLLADAVTLDIFERTVVQLIVEAMVKAVDTAVIKGSGDGQPLGITVDTRIPAGNIITLGSSEFATWDGWKKKVFAKIPLAYRAGGAFIMAAGTFEGQIDGMVDANGQPIGRVNYGITDGPQERFSGREVILVEDDVVAPYETASTGDIVAVFCKLSDYAMNSNMQMTMYRWLDHDTNQWVDKAILIADGKILDPNGVIIVKKGA